ncbi:MAG: ATP-dependent Clp protease adaptor ClpS [Muribaculaceae bacterium]|nr:ATP-dependent Clp protease adaptor ClpS [Muribaculaceae bacterium]
MPNEQVIFKNSVNSRTDEPRQFAVVLHNDDFTTMEFVVEVLMKVFYKSEQEAETLMLAVHHAGKARIGRYSYDIACSKALTATEMARTEGFPLRVTVEEA